MFRTRIVSVLCLVALSLTMVSCKKKMPDPPSDIEKRACDTLDGVQSLDRVALDPTVFIEGKGSLKVTAEMPITIKLYDIPFPGVENADLVYKAKIRTQDLAGSASLQMIVMYPNGGEFPAQQDAKTAPGGTSDWTECQVSLPVLAGQKPNNVSLNLSMDSMGGTAWIDDIHLVRVPK